MLMRNKHISINGCYTKYRSGVRGKPRRRIDRGRIVRVSAHETADSRAEPNQGAEEANGKQELKPTAAEQMAHAAVEERQAAIVYSSTHRLLLGRGVVPAVLSSVPDGD